MEIQKLIERLTSGDVSLTPEEAKALRGLLAKPRPSLADLAEGESERPSLREMASGIRDQLREAMEAADCQWGLPDGVWEAIEEADPSEATQPAKPRAKRGRKVSEEARLERELVAEAWQRFKADAERQGRRPTLEAFTAWGWENVADFPSDNLKDIRRILDAHRKS